MTEESLSPSPAGQPAASPRTGQVSVVTGAATIDELSAADLRACLEVNVVGTWLACRAAAGPMREADYGRILTLDSALGLVGGVGRAGYAASKGAVVQLTRSTGTVLPVDGGWTSH